MIVCTRDPYSVSLSYSFEGNTHLRTTQFQPSELIESGSERQVFPVLFCGSVSQPILLKKKHYIYIFNFRIQSVELSSHMISWNKSKQK